MRLLNVSGYPEANCIIRFCNFQPMISEKIFFVCFYLARSQWPTFWSESYDLYKFELHQGRHASCEVSSKHAAPWRHGSPILITDFFVFGFSDTCEVKSSELNYWLIIFRYIIMIVFIQSFVLIIFFNFLITFRGICQIKLNVIFSLYSLQMICLLYPRVYIFSISFTYNDISEEKKCIAD